jgi:hypothetical protein
VNETQNQVLSVGCRGCYLTMGPALEAVLRVFGCCRELRAKSQQPLSWVGKTPTLSVSGQNM